MSQNETLRRYVPRYQGVVSSQGKQYMKLENLVAHFVDPCVMDIKLGVRCGLTCRHSFLLSLVSCGDSFLSCLF